MQYEFKGPYDDSVTYAVGDVVTFGGIGYVCMEAAPKDHPTKEFHWHKLGRELVDTVNLLGSAVASQCNWVGEVDTTKDGVPGAVGYVEDGDDILLAIWVEDAWYTVALTEVTAEAET